MGLLHYLSSVQKVQEQKEGQGPWETPESTGFLSTDHSTQPPCHNYKGIVEHFFEFAKIFLFGNNFKNKNSAKNPNMPSSPIIIIKILLHLPYFFIFPHI